MSKEYEVMEHEAVPKHEIMSEDEKEELIDRKNIDLDDLPKILRNDPVVKEIGAEPGDVLKITRESSTAGKAIVYRYVIDRKE
ncbi:DNA-directed RNA polymerase subunit H [archaeon SCG-AAA382B04]|nr:DNA-directed RNA polymerase subunit H [archaeon SCG-AAA382B04]